jgi:hypothetical protein
MSRNASPTTATMVDTPPTRQGQQVLAVLIESRDRDSRVLSEGVVDEE